jgi:hypothetical protein
MDYNIFHWVWYLLGFIVAPRLTVAIALSIHARVLHLPLWLMIIVWLFAILGQVERKTK